MKMIKVNKKQITLENIQNSDYWGLISILVWNGFVQKTYRDQCTIRFEESYCGRMKNSTLYSDGWNSKDWRNLMKKDIKNGYRRKLNKVTIILERSDYIQEITISVRGAVNRRYYEKKGKILNEGVWKNDSHSSIHVINWMLKHKFLRIE